MLAMLLQAFQCAQCSLCASKLCGNLSYPSHAQGLVCGGGPVKRASHTHSVPRHPVARLHQLRKCWAVQHAVRVTKDGKDNVQHGRRQLDTKALLQQLLKIILAQRALDLMRTHTQTAQDSSTCHRARSLLQAPHNNAIQMGCVAWAYA